jgi:hypothetical protein
VAPPNVGSPKPNPGCLPAPEFPQRLGTPPIGPPTGPPCEPKPNPACVPAPEFPQLVELPPNGPPCEPKPNPAPDIYIYVYKIFLCLFYFLFVKQK